MNYGVIVGITMNQTYRTLILPAAFAATILAGAVSAQTPAAPAASPAPAATTDATDRGGRRFGAMRRLGFRHEMAQKLGLTDQQKSQIKSARQSARDQIRAIRADANVTPDEKKAQIRTVFENTRQQMKQVLTPDQQQKFEELQAERRAEHAPQPPANQ